MQRHVAKNLTTFAFRYGPCVAYCATCCRVVGELSHKYCKSLLPLPHAPGSPLGCAGRNVHSRLAIFSSPSPKLFAHMSTATDLITVPSLLVLSKQQLQRRSS